MRSVTAIPSLLRRYGQRVLLPAVSAALALVLCQCSTDPASSVRDADVVVSVKDQKLGYYRDGRLVQSYKVSTSKFGIGDAPGSCQTPLGKHEVVAKIGHGLPTGAVLKSRQWNGEVLKPNAPGRDPVVSRIMWLSGLEPTNKNALRRFIYIHGTTEEARLGKPASYGCVRMSMADVVSLFNEVNVGAKVVITKERLPSSEPIFASSQINPSSIPAPAAPASATPMSSPAPSSGSSPGELHSQYEPARSGEHTPPSGPIHGEPTLNGKQRLLIPVGHSLSKSSKKKPSHEVTLKSQKKGGPGSTAKKHKSKVDTAA